MSDTQELYALFGFNDYYPKGGVDALLTFGSYWHCVDYMKANAAELPSYGNPHDNYQLALISDLRKYKVYTRGELVRGSNDERGSHA
jgi:hypothetical protein